MKLIKLWLPVLLWAGLIFYFSGIPGLKTGLEYDFILRKIAHVTEYFVLTLLLYRAIKETFKLSAVKLFIYPALLSFLYAMSDELHQLFIAQRKCSALDVLIDTIGIAAFCIILKWRKSS